MPGPASTRSPPRSAGQVRDERLVRPRTYLDPQRRPRPEDLERDLLALARAGVALVTDFRDHLSLVRHIHREAGHVPAEVLDTWQEAGPRAVARELTVVMAALADHGLLGVHDDPAQAVAHFMALISSDIVQRSYWGVIPLPPEETDRITAAGVRAFLRAYAATRCRVAGAASQDNAALERFFELAGRPAWEPVAADVDGASGHEVLIR